MATSESEFIREYNLQRVAGFARHAVPAGAVMALSLSVLSLFTPVANRPLMVAGNSVVFVVFALGLLALRSGRLAILHGVLGLLGFMFVYGYNLNRNLAADTDVAFVISSAVVVMGAVNTALLFCPVAHGLPKVLWTVLFVLGPWPCVMSSPDAPRLYVIFLFGSLPTMAFVLLNGRRMLHTATLEFQTRCHAGVTDERLRAESQVLERQLTLAAAAQDVLAHGRNELTHGRLSMASAFLPAAKLSGDWFWHYLTEPRAGRGTDLRIFLGDVTGHGAGAAMIAAIVAGTCRSLATDPGLDARFDVSSTLRIVHGVLTDIPDRRHALTLSVLEFGDDCLTWHSAGAPPLFVHTPEGGIRQITAPSHLLGDDELVVNRRCLTLSPGSRVLAFSDGLTELRKPDGRQLGYNGVKRLFAESLDMPVEAARAHVLAKVAALRGEAPLDDDLTFVFVGCA